GVLGGDHAARYAARRNDGQNGRSRHQAQNYCRALPLDKSPQAQHATYIAQDAAQSSRTGRCRTQYMPLDLWMQGIGITTGIGLGDDGDPIAALYPIGA